MDNLLQFPPAIIQEDEQDEDEIFALAVDLLTAPYVSDVKFKDE